MPSVKQVLATKSQWLFIAPVRNLRLRSPVNFEYSIDRATFLATSRLPNRRRRLGFPQRISEMLRESPSLDDLLSSSESVVIVRGYGRGADLQESLLKIANEELAILALSQLGYDRRRNNAAPALEHPSNKRKLQTSLILNRRSHSWVRSGWVSDKVPTLDLGETWKTFETEGFFRPLVHILSRRVRVAPAWRRSLRQAAVLAGQSLMSRDLVYCFLWSWFALEVLLLTPEDKIQQALPERVEAFLGWTQEWRHRDLGERIREAYGKRNQLVHRGATDLVEVRDVLLVDDLLLNAFSNITRNPRVFGSKEGLVTFSERVRAEKVLGIDAKVRPQTLRAEFPRYSPKDFESF